MAEIKTNNENVSQTEHHSDCLLNQGKIFKKNHIKNFQIFIFWTLERSNYLNQRLKTLRIMSTFIFYHTQDSKMNRTLATIPVLFHELLKKIIDNLNILQFTAFIDTFLSIEV